MDRVYKGVRSLFGILIILTLVTTESWGLQKFVREPEDIETVKGRTIILPCIVEDLSSTVQWTRDGFGFGRTNIQYYPRYSFDGAKDRGEYNLMISNAQMEDDAVYECQVIATATTPGLRSKKAKVTVLYPCEPPVVEGSLPIPDTSRRRVEVLADSPTNLTCTAPNGRPAANITWYRDDKVADGDTYASVNVLAKKENATVMLNVTARRLESPVYECWAVNAAMARPLIERVELDVLYPPIVSIMVDPLREAREAGTVTFTCSATANPNILTWKWFIDDKLIEGAHYHVYRLSNVGRQHHAKTISCEAVNKVGSTKTGHLLNIQYSPQFKTMPLHPAVDLGDDATLTCEVDSNPHAAILWRRKDDVTEKILGSDKTLVIRKVSPAQLGVYTCSVSLLDFRQIQAEVHVLKKGPPVMLSSTDQAAKFGSVGEVECRVRLIPNAKITWSRDGVPLDFSKLERYEQRESSFASGVRSLLLINSVQDSDYGQLNCSVDNGYGYSDMVINFSKRAIIPVPYILAGALAGVVLIIAFSVGAYIYHRRQKANQDGESSSQGSEDSVTKKPMSDLPPSPFKTPYVDTWNTDQKYYRNSADYDELNYPPRDGRRSANPYDLDYPDGYGNYGYDRDYRRDYGTYPGPAGTYPGTGTYPGPNTLPPRPYETRYEPGPYGPVSHPGDYGPHPQPPRAPSRQSYTPSTHMGAPSNRLSTNV